MTEQRAKNFTLSLFSFLVHRSPPSTDHGRHPRWKEARSSGRNGVLASQNTLGPSKLSTFEPAYVHSDVPRVLVARIKRGLYRHMRSCEPAGGASKLYQPWRCAQYGVVLGRVRYGSHRSILSSLSPRARRSKSFFCGSGLFVFCSVLS